MEQLGFHWTNFFFTLILFLKSVEKIQVSLISDKNNGHFTWWPIYICDSISPLFFLEWEILKKKAVQKIKTHFVFNNFFPESRSVYETIWEKSIAEPQMTAQYDARALRAG
jgi:hypothetical protein